ncbi:MAG: FAD-dependent oxidoreductase [Spirochaetia bacterium]|nr:FAD-dependent oxidoreductase [Spirochaetia bacterium]
MKVLIVGGVAGGMSAAARLRRLSENMEITVVERGGYVSFANCGLPYYIGGEITERNNLLLQTPESFNARFNVNVRINTEAIYIDRVKKEVKTRNLKTGLEFVEKYDKLILSPGAEPLKPAIPGIDNHGIFTLRNMEDADRIYAHIRDNSPKKAVVVGGGYIGLETAENLKRRGIFVTVIEALPQVMGFLDPELAAIVHQHLKQKGIELYLGDGVRAFSDNSGIVKVTLASGREINADFVIFSIGVRPDTKLAAQAGLKLGTRGIAVDEYMQTSDPDIYAVGDAVESVNPLLGKSFNLPLAGPANKQGRIAADNIAEGNKVKYRGTLGTGILKIFDLTAASTGLNESRLSDEKIEHLSVLLHPGNHAGYYPGATQMSLKVIFSPRDGRILGAQAVGYEGVDKRIDVISMLMQKSGTVDDLVNFEHCYAPPFSSAKDPLNMAGFIAENVLKGRAKQVTAVQVINNPGQYVFLDVREKDEVELGMIPGALNIPLNSLRAEASRLPKDKKIAVYCRVGLRGYLASRVLENLGFTNVYNLSGGYVTYSALAGKQGNEGIFNEKAEMGMHKPQEVRAVPPGPAKILAINACGLQCPGPIMKLKSEIDSLRPGDRVEISATDPGFYSDISAWARTTGNNMLSLESDKGVIKAVVEKAAIAADTGKGMVKGGNDKTIIVFSGDLDKLIASFIIANGALAMGRRVTMFFTFWGLNALKRPKQPNGLKKNIIEKAFGFMLPRGSKKMGLSRLNMAGIGPVMIRNIMKQHNISSVEELIASAQSSGVRLVGCQMTMDLLGIKKEELIDGVEIGGVATMLESAEASDSNLFI